jgi:hypothetical protein
MTLTTAQLADLRGIVAKRIGAPEITEDRMICPACGGDDYGPNMQPGEMDVWTVDNRLPLWLRGVCVDCGHVQEPTSFHVIEAAPEHVRELWLAPDDWVLWLNAPFHELPRLELASRHDALRPFIIAERHHLFEVMRIHPALALDSDMTRLLDGWQEDIAEHFPLF